MRTLTTGRALFTGQAGYYNLSEPGTHDGDVLALLSSDHFVPFILRPIERGYEMVGVAYIPGLMLESAIAAIKADWSILEPFTIVWRSALDITIRLSHPGDLTIHAVPVEM